MFFCVKERTCDEQDSIQSNHFGELAPSATLKADDLHLVFAHLKIDALPEINFGCQLLPGNYDKGIPARRDGEMFSALCQHLTGSLRSSKKWALGGGHIPDIPCRLFQ
jgi:hypothetical protein